MNPSKAAMASEFIALPTQYLTVDRPGVGGSLKSRNEDFLVEEIPAYEPCGDGEHLYLTIEKKGRPTLEVVNAIARHFGVKRQAVGFAGMKDKYAITRQYISIHTFDDQPLDTLNVHGVTVLASSRHRNQLRIGHLKGNRFTIKIRDVAADQEGVARDTLEFLATKGCPNFIGEQRFGSRMSNHLIGKAYLLQDWQEACDLLLGGACENTDPDYVGRDAYDKGDFVASARQWMTLPSERAVARALSKGKSLRDAFMILHDAPRRFFVTAFQSAVFNNVLSQRMNADTLTTLEEGDVACKHLNGAMFAIGSDEVADPTTVERLESLEISPSGPLWGYKMMEATGTARDTERDCLKQSGIDIHDFNTPPHRVPGVRRPLRIPVTEPVVSAGEDEHGDYVQTSFQLPKGSFATTILREIMKTPDRKYPWGPKRTDDSTE